MITGRESNIIRCMAPEVREREEAKQRAAEARYIAEVEKTEQQLFNKWLKEQCVAGKLYFVNARSDKPSTIRPGHPDYTIWIKDKVILIEMKVAGGKLSDEQQQAIWDLERLGHVVWITWNHHQAIAIVEHYLTQFCNRKKQWISH